MFDNSVGLEHWVFVIVGWWLFERVILTWVLGGLLLKRPPLVVNAVSSLQIMDGGYARFALDYCALSRFTDAVVSYEIWSKTDPKVSIAVKERALCYDKVQGGDQREYLPLQLPSKDVLSESSEWGVRVRVISTKHTFNPFHKIYPCVFEFTQQLSVNHEQ